VLLFYIFNKNKQIECVPLYPLINSFYFVLLDFLLNWEVIKMKVHLPSTAIIATVFISIVLLIERRRSRPSTKNSNVARLRSLSKLKNEYWAIRHGESEANAAAVVSSDSILARNQHGLTAKGREDARNGAWTIIRESFNSSKKMIIIHSPFLRTKETADIVNQILLKEQPNSMALLLTEDDLLRERSFGIFEGRNSHHSYEVVWARDEIDGCLVNDFECESVYSVSERAAEVIMKCESLIAPDGDHRIILVSHGDTLQILRATLDRTMDTKYHRHGDHLTPGQAIRLNLA